MAAHKPRICIVSPCYNEQEVLPLFCQELRNVFVPMNELDYEIIFVDDGSTDGTLDVLNELAEQGDITVLSLSRNFGHQIALTAGLEFARGGAVILMDSDLQHPPSLIPQMVRRWQEGFDIVSAVRTKTADAGVFKNFSSRAFYWLINKLSDTPIEPGATDFCLLSLQARRALLQMPERHRFLRGLVAWMGFKRAFIPFEAPPRAAGTTKYSLRKMIRLATDAAFSFSIAPIRLGIRAGLLTTAAGLIYLLYILLNKAIYGLPALGWGSLISTILILGGVQLMLIGLIGEYLGRVFEQVKNRPLYLLKQKRRLRRDLTESPDDNEDLFADADPNHAE